MSSSIYLYRFVGGEPVPPDPNVIRAVLEPHAVNNYDASQDVWIRAADGYEAEVFIHEHSITFDRPGPGGIFDILAELAVRLDATIIAPGGPIILRGEEDRAHLPESVRDGAVVVEDLSGAAIERAFRGDHGEEPRQILVRAQGDASPLYVADAGPWPGIGDFTRSVPAESLGFPEATTDQLMAWSKDRPGSSSALRQHVREGVGIAQRVARNLGRAWAVRYWDERHNTAKFVCWDCLHLHFTPYSHRAVEASERVIRLVRENEDISHHGDGCTQAMVERAEQEMGLTFPPSYRRLLEEFGTWDVPPAEFPGVYRTPAMGDVLLGTVEHTLDDRAAEGLPHHFMVIMHDDVWNVIVLDTSRPDRDGEYPVYAWHPEGRDVLEQVGDNFGSFALEECRRALGT
ncbi:SMI1/KNR4 family protein [Streptomyces albicerus]|uniref:SMI1/KNR4 family protein n=1 Tax=Streptomyces albicerus TaxID=2569859 RepID=UPI00124BA3ED|nr:SMI1/KNR4 family protein [Streptomyces albicerus]